MKILLPNLWMLAVLILLSCQTPGEIYKIDEGETWEESHTLIRTERSGEEALRLVMLNRDGALVRYKIKVPDQIIGQTESEEQKITAYEEKIVCRDEKCFIEKVPVYETVITRTNIYMKVDIDNPSGDLFQGRETEVILMPSDTSRPWEFQVFLYFESGQKKLIRIQIPR